MKRFLLYLCLFGYVFANNNENSKLQNECEAGNMDKCFELASILEDSCEKTPNFEIGAKAIKYYEKVCNSNEAHIYTACIRLAGIYNRGNCAQENSPKTLKYLKLSCDKENLTNVCTAYRSSLDTIENLRNDCKNGDNRACEWLKSRGY